MTTPLEPIAAPPSERRSAPPRDTAVGAVCTRARGWQSRYPIAQILALVLVFGWGSATIDGYASGPSIRSMLVLASLLGLAALPQTIVVLLGGLDLSIPAFITVGGVMTTELGGAHGWPVAAIIPAIIVVCAAAGTLNGFLCHRLGVNPLIITLGMYAVALGAVLVWTGGAVTAAPPASLTDVTSAIGTTFGVAVAPVVVIWALVTVITGVILSRTAAGRRLYATGVSLRAARHNLIRTSRVWMTVFALSATLAGLTGVLVAGYSGGASQSMGDVYLFQGLAAVIVGGTLIGRAGGDYWRTVIGALLLTALTTILVGHGFSSAEEQILFGAVILVVVWGHGRGPRVRDRI